MLRRAIHSSMVLLVAVIVTATSASALAQDVEDGEAYRIILTNGKEVVGEVTELEDVYRVKVGSGITMTIRKSRVRELIPVEEEQAGDEGALRRRITDAEIEEILGSESVEDLYVWEYIEQVDLVEPLDFDHESVQEMIRFAGKAGRVLETPHFVCVYTSDIADARRLVGRLEIVYKWNVTFMRMHDIPPKRPDHKIEIFYFGTHEEYTGYSTLCGWMGSGALGFYMHTNNRCAFFDMNTWPPVAAILKRSKDKNIPYDERRKAKNEYQRWANFLNLEVVQHEATHAIHFNIGVFPKMGSVGTWMVEGLCVQFEVPPTQGGGSFGAINYSRLNSFHKMYMQGDRVVRPWEFVKNMILAPNAGFDAYVMGWALNYYLRKQFKEEYGEWMRLLAAQEDEWSVKGPDLTSKLADFEGIFGKLDEEFVKEFYDYIAAIPIRRSLIVEFPAGRP